MRVKIQPSLNGFTSSRSLRSSHNEEERKVAVHALIRTNPKRIIMTGLRFVAAVLLALILSLAWDGLGHPAFAQFQRATPSQGRPPVAAPSGAPAEATPLAAPPGTVDTNLVGSRSEIQAAFTPVGLFLRADIVVKFVLAALILASFWSWVLIIDKWIAFGSLNRKARRFEKNFWSGRSLDELYAQHAQRSDQPFTAVFVAALREWKRSFEGGPPREAQLASVKDRVEKVMSVSIQREVEKIERGLSY